MLTRRVRGRTFLLRPSPRTNALVRYVVAAMVRKWHMKLHAITVMSNHWHLVLTDPEGNVVDFQRDCHAFVARALNAAHGEFEAVWSSSATSRVECAQSEDIVERIAYTMANPVEAGLVRYGSSWPGVRHAWPCRPRSIRRPRGFFRGANEAGAWPDVVTLELSRPPGYDELADDELAAVIAAAIEAREEMFRRKHDRKHKRTGRRSSAFLGRRAVLAQRRHDRPGTRESRFRMSPKVACRDKWRRIERIEANKAWLAEYNDARRSWAAGLRDVVFPAGTYKLRVQHGVYCAPPPG